MTPSTHLTPHQAIHPGLHLKEELVVRGIKQNELAAETGILPSQLNEILKGKRPVTPDLAVLFGAALDGKPERWNSLQANYNLSLALIEKTTQEKVANIHTWQEIKKVVPVSYFRKEGELSGDLSTDIKHLSYLLDFSSTSEMLKALKIDRPAGILFKKSSKLAEHVSHVTTWVRYVKHLSADIKAPSFEPQYQSEVMAKLKSLFLGHNVLEKLPSVLKHYGIKVIVKSKPDHAPLDGAAFWHNESPVIGLTLRHQRYDNLLFTLYHELGHIFLHFKQNKDTSFVDSLEDSKGTLSLQEEQANEFARNALVPVDKWTEFTFGRTKFSDADIQRFADSVGTPAPSIWGRLCFDGRMKYACASVHRANNQIP